MRACVECDDASVGLAMLWQAWLRSGEHSGAVANEVEKRQARWRRDEQMARSKDGDAVANMVAQWRA